MLEQVRDLSFSGSQAVETTTYALPDNHPTRLDQFSGQQHGIVTSQIAPSIMSQFPDSRTTQPQLQLPIMQVLFFSS